MKKVLALVLVILMLLPNMAYAKKGELRMTFQQFVDSYNSIPAPLTSPALILGSPDDWLKDGSAMNAIYKTDKTTESVKIMLRSIKADEKTMGNNLDIVYIYCYEPKDIAAFIMTAYRCTSVFLGYYTDMSAYSAIATSIIDYHERGYTPETVTDYFTQRGKAAIQEIGNYFLYYYEDTDTMYFEIRYE